MNSSDTPILSYYNDLIPDESIEQRLSQIVAENQCLQQKLHQNQHLILALQEQYQQLPLPSYTWHYDGEHFRLENYNESAQAEINWHHCLKMGQTLGQTYPANFNIEANIWQCWREKKSRKVQECYDHPINQKPQYFLINYIFISPQRILIQIQDVTASYEQQTHLKNQKTFLENILQQVADGILILSRQGKIYFVNKAAATLFGRSAEDLQDYDFGYPISNGITEVRLHRPDGTFIIAQMRVSEINWEQTTAYLASLRDITTEQKIQANLAESESRFRLMADHAPMLIWVTNQQGKLTFVNQGWAKINGTISPKIIGSKWLKNIHPDDYHNYLKTYKEAIAEKAEFQLQFRFKHPHKGYQWLFNRGVPRLTPEGEFLGFIGSCVDISEHKQLEDELLKVTQAVESSGEAVGILNIHGQSMYHNPAFICLFGYSTQEINQMGGLASLFRGQDVQRFNQMLTTIKSHQQSQQGELSLNLGKRQQKQISLQIDVILSQEIHCMGFVITATDISKRIKVERELKQTNHQLKATIRELEQKNQEIAQLNTIVKLLQACLSIEEAYQVLKQQIPRLFEHLSGNLYLMIENSQILENLICWGKDRSDKNILGFQDCWSLRCGYLHWNLDPNTLPCQHQNGMDLSHLETLCLPLNGQGECFGLLSLHRERTKKPYFTENQRQFSLIAAENIAMTFANLKLREKLKQEAIRDPLTHLYNRRYLEMSLSQELSRSQRTRKPVSVIMIDIDHFKQINDSFGHAAGDLVLRKLGEFLQQNIRKSDIACRFGGEELTVVLPEANLEQAADRAEQLRLGIKHLALRFHQHNLGEITASFGVASFPDYGKTEQDMLHIADLALYCAKKEGRDRVVTANRMFSERPISEI